MACTNTRSVNTPVAVRQFSSTMTVNNSSFSQIRLVTTEHDVRRFTVGIRLELTQPALYVDERLFVTQIKHQQESHRVAEERVRQTTKPIHTVVSTAMVGHNIACQEKHGCLAQLKIR